MWQLWSHMWLSCPLLNGYSTKVGPILSAEIPQGNLVIPLAQVSLSNPFSLSLWAYCVLNIAPILWR